jgi:hypothetical protein
MWSNARSELRIAALLLLAAFQVACSAATTTVAAGALPGTTGPASGALVIAAWTAGTGDHYEFLRDGEFSHCGVDAFHFARMSAGWQITGLAYTVRRQGCREPRGSRN